MAKKLNALEIRSVELSKNVKAIGVDIHNHLVSIMLDIIKNRNTGIAAHFLKLLMNADKEGNSKSVVRADAVKNWLEAFAFFKYPLDKKTGKRADKLNKTALDSLLTPADIAAHIKTAKANPWYKYTSAKPFDAALDIVAIIKGAVKRAEDRKVAALKGEVHLKPGAVDNMPDEMIDALKALVAGK